MPVYQIAAIFFSLSLVILCLSLTLPYARKNQQALCFVLLQFSLVGHLLAPVFTTYTESFWQIWLSGALRASIPSMFWLVCNLSFDDRFRLNRNTLAIASLVMLVPALGNLLVYLFSLEYSFLFHWLMNRLPQWLEFLLIAHALFIACKSMRDDLVESRREMRVWLLSSVGCYIALVVVLEQFFAGGPALFVAYRPVILALLLLVFYGRLLHFRADMFAWDLRTQEPELPVELHSPEFEVTKDPIIARLQELMSEQQVYKREGLTISDLAAEMSVQEYRLRRLINQQLGYRNFNDFLNGYRVHEACQRLTSDQDAGLPVLTIALDTGFRSLSAFNRAFKERTGTTPTQFRKLRPDIPPAPQLTPALEGSIQS